MHTLKSHKKSHPHRTKTVFVVFSDAYQELTLVRTGLLDDLISNYRIIIIVGSVLVSEHIQLHYKSTPIATFVCEDRPFSWWDRVIHALIASKYEKYAGPFRQARRKAARSRKHLLGIVKSLVRPEFPIKFESRWIIGESIIILG